jgi:DNA replicative helicase MCM subunit Mcm2 (Cdc46/Mcm family)
MAGDFRGLIMSETKYKVETVKTAYVCDRCAASEMKYDPRPQERHAYCITGAGERIAGYRHRCENCGHTAYLRKTYPFLKHVKVVEV